MMGPNILLKDDVAEIIKQRDHSQNIQLWQLIILITILTALSLLAFSYVNIKIEKLEQKFIEHTKSWHHDIP